MTRILLSLALIAAFVAVFFFIMSRLEGPPAYPVPAPGAGVHPEELEHDLYRD